MITSNTWSKSCSASPTPPTGIMTHVRKHITLKITLSLIHSKFCSFFLSCFKKEVNKGKIRTRMENLSFVFEGVSTPENGHMWGKLISFSEHGSFMSTIWMTASISRLYFERTLVKFQFMGWKASTTTMQLVIVSFSWRDKWNEHITTDFCSTKVSHSQISTLLSQKINFTPYDQWNRQSLLSA